MKKLQIDENQALKLYKSASSEFKQVLEDSFGKEYFNQKITDKIQTLEDVFEYFGLDEDDIYIFNKNTKNKFERYINACSIIPKITSVYNEGTILDWTNFVQHKYKPYYKKVGSSWIFNHSVCWFSVTHTSSAYYFKSIELSNDSAKKFNDIYIDFFSYEG